MLLSLIGDARIRPIAPWRALFKLFRLGADIIPEPSGASDGLRVQTRARRPDLRIAAVRGTPSHSTHVVTHVRAQFHGAALLATPGGFQGSERPCAELGNQLTDQNPLWGAHSAPPSFVFGCDRRFGGAPGMPRQPSVHWKLAASCLIVPFSGCMLAPSVGAESLGGLSRLHVSVFRHGH